MKLEEGIGVGVGVFVAVVFLVVFLTVGLAVNAGGGISGGPVPAQQPNVSIPQSISVTTVTTPLPTTVSTNP